MLIDDLNLIPDMFKKGTRGLLLLYGEQKNAFRKALKRISRDKEEWEQIISDFRGLQLFSQQYKNHRIYSSVNSRNMEKAIHEFKKRSLDVDYGNYFEKYLFYTDIQNRFFSCLMNPNCQTESNFLIDCDSADEFKLAMECIPREHLLFDYETKNGHHIITKPFNPNDYPAIEIKKDDLMYIG